MAILDFEPITINNKKYFTVKQFARLTYHSESSIRALISKGNRMRKLKAERFGSSTFIPYDELGKYPFTFPGRCEDVHHFDYKEVTGVSNG